MDPNTAAWLEVAKQLGVAAPLVVALVYLLQRSEKREQLASLERREMTDKHLGALNSVVTENRIGMAQLTTAVQNLTNAVTEDITTNRESRAHDREEHRAMLDALGKATIRSRGREDET